MGNKVKLSCSIANEKPKRKCKNYDASKKLDILKELDSNTSSITELSLKYGIDARTIRNWRQHRPKLEELSRSNSKLQRKRKRKIPFEPLEKALATWYTKMRQRSVPVNGPLIQAKALELSKEMDISENFVASEGWFSNWKARHGIGSLKVCDQKMSDNVEIANVEAADIEISNIKITNAEELNKDFGLIIKEEPADMFNAHGTSMSCKTLSEGESQNQEDITPEQAISAADTLMLFYKKNHLLTPNELAVLRKCKNNAIILNIQQYK